MTPADLVATLVKAKAAATLKKLAIIEHSYENSDIGCGVQFNDDGTVYLYAGWDEYEATIPYADYLALLAAHPD